MLDRIASHHGQEGINGAAKAIDRHRNI